VVTAPATVAVEKQITDIKQLAGQWEGWVNSQLSGCERVLMTIKADGSYRAATTRDGGTLTVGTYYLKDGKVRYNSSRSEGTETTLTLTPEGSFNPVTGPATYQRMK
jgi:hypothetical protein